MAVSTSCRRLTFGGVGVDIIGRNDGQIETHGDGERVGHFVQIGGLMKKLQRNPEFGQAGLERPALGHQCLDIGQCRRPQGQTFIDAPVEVLDGHTVFALGRAAPEFGDESGQLTVGAAIGAEQDQFEAFLELELRPYNQSDVMVFGCHVGLHQSGE